MTDSVARQEIHHRQLEIRFFQRSDGLFEVEGRLLDRKSHPFRRLLQDRDTPAGTPLHDILVRLVIDESLLVHDASATLAASPFDVCRGAANTLAPLKGLRIGAGWNRRVRELLGGAASCTHVVELLGPMATTVYQGLAPAPAGTFVPLDLDMAEVGRAVDGKHGLRHMLAFTKAMGRQAGKVLPQLTDLAREGADIVVHHPVLPLGQHLAEMLQVPAVVASPLPGLVPTREFLSPAWPAANLKPSPMLNRPSYRAAR